ncbi:beta-ketoacyl-ACP synthase [Neisseria shayeganii]|uniref:Beta-ketoacyl-ACP synthase n=1 Tax=Neisseria shayeganii TaxID=607712 RepID=A0A7D7NCU0_9NEIS|nr:beta-ketoacyl-ACP synthase [Neisseria shayeganii]QMT41595.1 beta-ketoacyl-ACP synthase [Neisseria shayeganii]
MMKKRVVITGIGALSAFGRDWQSVQAAFQRGKNAVRYMPDWEAFPDLEARIAAPLPEYRAPAHWSRKQLRSMGVVAQYTVDACEQALQQAGLLGDPIIRDGRMGVACGSSVGSTPDVQQMGLLLSNLPSQFNANTYVRMMPHSMPANVGIFFGLTGRMIPTSSACTSGSQGIGYAYEAIKHGLIPMMLAGGAEQLCPSEVFVFDSLYAASRRNGAPESTPRPYDAGRDGLVVGEGACMMVLEELEHAQARGAHIIAEIVGYGANSDGSHITRPEKATMQRCMELALQDAGLPAGEIGYVSGHGTATEQGDIAETQATAAVFGHVPLSSQKSYLGHTLGACGALESWFAIEMMRSGWFAPTVNLEQIDERCGEVDYIRGNGRHIETEYVVNNNFAFGGVNTSLVFRRW